MKKTYDRGRATLLVPMLRSITREIRERTCAADELRKRLSAEALPDRRRDLQADLAIQLREAREALDELEKLGCSLEREHPLRVFIPGRGGVAGFTWLSGSSEVEPLVADSAV